jgi:hypothetical protein
VLLLTIILFSYCDVCGEEVMMMKNDECDEDNSKRNQEMLC